MDRRPAVKKSPSPGQASLTWRTRTSRAMASHTHGQRRQRTMLHPAAGILRLVSTQMGLSTLFPQIWTVMIFGTARMMVQHGHIPKLGIVMPAVMQTSLLTAMIMFTSLIITAFRAQATCSTPCMMEHHGQITGASPTSRTTKFP